MFPAFLNDYLTAGGTAFAVSFYAAAALTVFCAFKTVQSSAARPFAVYFCLTMLGLACVYGLLNSPFTAELQIVIMGIGATALLCQAYYLCKDLPKLTGSSIYTAPWLNGGAAVLMLVILFFLLKGSSYFQDYKLYAPENTGHRGYYSDALGNRENLGAPYTVSQRLLTAYAFPLEITAVLIFIIALAMSVCRRDQFPRASFAEIWLYLKTPDPAEPPAPPETPAAGEPPASAETPASAEPPASASPPLKGAESAEESKEGPAE